MLGGAMRQAGIMAAACLYALDHHVARLAEDHAHAAKLAEALQALPGLSVAGPVETNIVLLELTADGLSAHWLAEQLALRGIRVGVFGIISLRLITHLDINNAAIDRTVEALRQILGTRR
jgi:threonine aldolase